MASAREDYQGLPGNGSESVFLTQGAFGEIRLKTHHHLSSFKPANTSSSKNKKGCEILVVVKSIRNAFVVANNDGSKNQQDSNNNKTKEDEDGERLLSYIMPNNNNAQNDFPYKLSRAAVREVTALKYLTEQQHTACQQKGDKPRIVPLLDLIPPKAGDLSPTLGLVMPYCSMDLAFLLQSVVRPNGIKFQDGFEMSTLKRFAKDVLAALEFCHSRKIMHRDAKPSNFLLSSQGILQLADFGLAKSFASSSSSSNAEENEDVQATPTKNEASRHPELEATNGICSLHYRPPEIMFGCTTYGPEVDVFSAGLIVAELYNLRPLLPGQNVLDQIALQINTLGTPPATFSNGDTVSEKWPDYGKLLTFAPTVPIPLASLSPRSYCDPMGQELIQAMLQMDPTCRPSANACLQHSWFLNGYSMAPRQDICSQFMTASSSSPLTQRHAPSCVFPVVMKGGNASEATTEPNKTNKQIEGTATADWDMPLKWHTARISKAWNPGEAKQAGAGSNAIQNSISGIGLSGKSMNQVYAQSLKKVTNTRLPSQAIHQQ